MCGVSGRLRCDLLGVSFIVGFEVGLKTLDRFACEVVVVVLTSRVGTIDVYFFIEEARRVKKGDG